MLIAKIQNTALSAIEAFAPSQVDYQMLDRAWAFCCRAAMAGAAHVEMGRKHSTMGTYDVLKHWQLACCETEATVRRVRWYQAVAAEPSNNLHMLCGWFATADAEKSDPLLHSARSGIGP